METFPELATQVRRQRSIGGVRKVLLGFLSRQEAPYRYGRQEISPLEYYLVRACVQNLKSIFSLRGERVSGSSAARSVAVSMGVCTGPQPSEAFWQDLYHLFLGAAGRSKVYEGVKSPAFLKLTGRDAGRVRSRELDRLARSVRGMIDRYPHGLSPQAVARRRASRRRVLHALDGSSADWSSYRWQLKHIIREAGVLGRIISLTPSEREAINMARQKGIPFGVTPYYASLMDQAPHRKRDHAVRAQVIPTPEYVRLMSEARACASGSLDFMGETDTSPVDLVTRRYPQIAIFKPFNTCAQICVYCQRNWEIRDAMQSGSLAPASAIHKAMAWFRNHKFVEEVLITGGDPLMLPDYAVSQLLGEFARMPHIRRVRIGTRAPVVLPMRFTPTLLRILARFARAGQRLAIVTHFEHPYEVTPEAAEAVRRLRSLGFDVYNQQVFTLENSRRFETSALRFALKRIGVDPYYTFFPKGKEETRSFHVPIARILQERKEEARLTPGDVRTDEPVFNLPRLGKNHLRAGQDHHLIGLAHDGSRVYEFLPWEKNLYPSPTYVHRDLPILNYLQRLQERGEDPADYRTIWYYF